MKRSGDRNQCPSCGEFFNSTFAFDKHRTGDYSPNTRRCLSVAEMEGKGMSRGASGYWISSTMPRQDSWAPVARRSLF